MNKIDLEGFEELFTLLRDEGYCVVGPTIRDGAIIYDELDAVADLPIGWTDEQSPGVYRVKQRDDQAYFGYNAGPHSWKKYLFPPRRKLWEAKRKEGSVSVKEEPLAARKLAFLGVRSCEIEAIFIQDKVFIEGNYVDPFYKKQRDNALVIAVNCTQAASTCFCVSMSTGPKAKRGYDLSLTEVVKGEEHYFVAEGGSEKGKALLNRLSHTPCEDKDIDAAHEGVKRAEEQMEGQLGLDTLGINDLLYRNLDNDRWDEVANRCLSCANCTLACPTCFCSDVEEVSDLTGDHTERWKTWDSCFNLDHSFLNSGAVRTSTKSRYRQWLTHKVGSWIDQFGTSGCVGCGRCIAWCPVGIDLREEMAAIRETDSGKEEE